MADDKVHNVVIVGAGPAGWTAGIYLGRANLNPVVYCGAQPGGQLTTTTDVENFPGFPKGIDGPKLMDGMQEQAEKYGTEVVYDEITEVNFSDGNSPHVLKAGDSEVKAHAVILATGASPRMLGLPSEKTFWNYGVHTCAVCDGNFYRNKVVAVVGGGDSAMEEATYLAHICEKVFIVHRRDEFRASQIMEERARRAENIEFIWNSVVDEVLGDQSSKYPKTTGIRVKNVKTGETSEHAVSAMFLAIGHIPNTKFLKNEIETDGDGYVKIDKQLRTNVQGVYAAGDVHDFRYRQAVTAAGYGCQAALEVERYLGEKGVI